MTSKRQLFQQLGDATSPKTLDGIADHKTHKRHQCDLQSSCAQCTRARSCGKSATLCSPGNSICSRPARTVRGWKGSTGALMFVHHSRAKDQWPPHLDDGCPALVKDRESAQRQWDAPSDSSNPRRSSCALTVYATQRHLWSLLQKCCCALWSILKKIPPLLKDRSDWYWPERINRFKHLLFSKQWCGGGRNSWTGWILRYQALKAHYNLLIKRATLWCSEAAHTFGTHVLRFGFQHGLKFQSLHNSCRKCASCGWILLLLPDRQREGQRPIGAFTQAIN